MTKSELNTLKNSLAKIDFDKLQMTYEIMGHKLSPDYPLDSDYIPAKVELFEIAFDVICQAIEEKASVETCGLQAVYLEEDEPRVILNYHARVPCINNE